MRLMVATIGAALLAVPAVAQNAAQPAALSASQGMAAIQAKEPAKAIELLRPVLAGFERDYAGEKRQIYCAITPQQSAAYLAGAARDKQPAVAIGPDWCRAQYVNGYALIDLGRLPEAQAAFEKLVGFAPQNSRYLNELGFILVKERKFPEALEVYRRADAAADLSPERTAAERCVALKGTGYILYEQGRLTDAAAAYRQCLAVDPADKDSAGELDNIRAQWRLNA